MPCLWGSLWLACFYQPSKDCLLSTVTFMLSHLKFKSLFTKYAPGYQYQIAEPSRIEQKGLLEYFSVTIILEYRSKHDFDNGIQGKDNIDISQLARISQWGSYWAGDVPDVINMHTCPRFWFWLLTKSESTYAHWWHHQTIRALIDWLLPITRKISQEKSMSLWVLLTS